MAISNKLPLVLALLLLLLLLALRSSQVLARDVPHEYEQQHRRMALLGGSSMGECWTAMMQLRSCTNEIILFLVNGESYLGQDCCRAIRVITWHCWPTMLTSLGFTPEEGDVLRGYCDATISFPPPPQPPVVSPPSPAPAPAPAPATVI